MFLSREAFSKPRARTGGALLLAFLGALALGTSSARAADDLLPLLEKMGGQDMAARYPAFAELQRRRDPAVLAPLMERIGEWDLGAQSYGVSLLENLGAPALPGWKRLATSPSLYLRGCAGLHVHPSDPAKGVALLVEVLGTAASDPSGAASLLGRMAFFKDPAVQRAVRALVDPKTAREVLLGALTNLANVRDADAAPRVRALLGDPDGALIAVAAAWLLRLGEQEPAASLAAAIDAGNVTHSDFIRIRPWLEQADRVPEVVLDALLRRAEAETNVYYLESMLQVLAHAHHAPAVPVLRRLLDHDDPKVGRAAFEALAALPGGLDAETVRAQLKSADPVRRLAAADALRRADDPAGLEAVLQLAKAGSAQREEAVRVLAGFRVDAAVEPLIDALVDDAITTRANAYNGLVSVLPTLFPYRRVDLASTGYRTDATPAVRADAAARIRAWWQANKDKPW